jgi:MFS family permease
MSTGPTAAPTPTVSARAQSAIVGLMFGLSVMSYFDRTIFAIATPSIMKEFGISAVMMGAVTFAFQISYALVMIPGGRLADRFGPRVVLTAMALGSAFFTAMMPFGATPGLGTLIGVVPGLILMRIGFGIFTAPIYPTCTKTNANWIPLKNRARATGCANAGAGFGGAVSPILFTWMISRYGWRTSFLWAGLATAILGIGWFLYVRDYPRGAEPPKVPATRVLAPWRALLTDKNLILLTLGFGALDYFEYIFFYWIFYYLGEIRQLGATESARYTTLLFLAWVLMMPMGGFLCDRLMARFGHKLGLRLVACTSMAFSAVLLFAGVNATGTLSAVTLMALALGFAAIADVTYWTATIGVAGVHAGTAGGIMNTGGNIGGGLAPVVTPWIASFAGWSWGLYFGCFMALAAMVAWLFTDPTRRIKIPAAASR